MSDNIWSEIWKLQGELNKLVGVDTLAMGDSPDGFLQLQWLENYCDEAANEAFEAKENFFHKWWVKEVKLNPSLRFTPIDVAKIKLELIDILHFLVSALQVYGDFDCIRRQTELAPIINDFHAYQRLNEVIISSLEDEPGSALDCLKTLFSYFKMQPEDILCVYKKKHAANVERQKSGYAQATKTETDNNKIEAEIR